MNTIKLLVNIDQTAALRAGVAAPHSTAHVDVDPATLPQDVRDWLAERLREGHDLTHAVADHRGQQRRLRLVRPTQDDLLSAVQGCIAWTAERLAERTAAAAQSIREYRDGATRIVWVGLTADGRPSDYSGAYVAREIRVPNVPYRSEAYGDPDYSVAQSEAERDAASAMDAARAALLAVDLPRKRAEDEAAEERAAAERSAVLALLTTEQRQRYDAGCLPEHEMHARVREHLLGPPALAPECVAEFDADDVRVLGVCSAEQWAVLRAARAAARPGVTVDLVDVGITDPDVLLRETASGLGYDVVRFSAPTVP